MKRTTHIRLVALMLALIMGTLVFAGCTTEAPVTEPTTAPEAEATNVPEEGSDSTPDAETDRTNWPKYMGIGTGGASSQTGLAGAVLAPVLSEALGISVSSEVSAGTTANLLMVNDGTCELGLTGTDFAYEAWTGTATWTDETCQDFRSVVPLFPFIHQQYAPASSDVYSVADIEGKTMNMSNAGSSSDTWMRRILEVAGVECNITNLAPSDGNQQLADGLIDCAVVNGLAPHTAISEFAATNEARLFGIDDDLYNKLVEKYPYAARYTIEAGTYDWQTEDVQTISTYCVFICSKDLDEGLVYEMTKAIFENLESLCGQLSAFEYVQADLVNLCTTPLHAGAARYYEEIGIEIPENLKPVD